jgi:hypothetical protein
VSRGSLVCIAFCAAVAASCTSTEPIPSGGMLTTDATTYVAHPIEGSGAPPRYRFSVITRFENTWAVTLYLGRCTSESSRPLFSVAVADSPSTEAAYSQIWACVGHDRQFKIVPGAVRVDTFQVEGPNVYPAGDPIGLGIREGRFKMSFDVRLAPGDGARLAPSSFGFSNAFRVDLSQ